MKPDHFTPFIKSVGTVFETMLNLQVSIDKPYCRSATAKGHDISAVIGLTGDVVGSVVLGFSNEAARSIVARLCQTEDLSDAELYDAVGELVNMISGSAKAMMEGRRTSISCPSVITGPGHTIAGVNDRPVIVIPCSTECGSFSLELILDFTGSRKKAA